MKVLVVWEEIRENTEFYLLEGDDAERALAAHNRFVNIEGIGEKFAIALSDLLEKKRPLDSTHPIVINKKTTVILSGMVI